ncbi:galactosylceramide sulfotransferase-like isoform X2 [Dreissena polymorpha]|uniref:galactosylceramide sulfotransferase-like isoform X2 n=1 Tax=Dreissena polymorpha TaxID=45954 RepID=UPI002264BB77|nr:galactosylceramide sulfotransferase-like isoform X2 [Dreissena polymorpha]
MAQRGKSKIKYVLFLILKQPDKKTTSNDGEVRKKKLSRARCCFILLAVLIIVSLVCTHDLIFNISHYVARSWNISQPEVRHIGFLKVHKAGGSTIQNILFRYGLHRNVTFVIPKTGYKFSTPFSKTTSILNNKRGEYYDILAIHSVYNETSYSRLLPADAANIAIIRNPLELFVSAAYYHRDVWHVPYLKRVPTDNYVQNLIRYPELYDNQVLSLTRNSMAMDFGFPSDLHPTEESVILNFLNYLDKRFDLVLVVEFFTESLVLLKRLLHWKLQDIVYIPQNTNTHPALPELNLTSSDVDKFELRNFLDKKLYDYFLKIFKQKTHAAGHDFFEEVGHFENVIANVTAFCVFKERDGSEMVVPDSYWSEKFAVKPSDCREMLITELEYIDKIRSKIMPTLRGLTTKYWTP